MMCPFDGEGGPVADVQSDMPSAEYMSKFDDSESEEIKTVEIKEFWPEYYQAIEECQDEVQVIGVKQMIKLKLKKEINENIKELNSQNNSVISSPLEYEDKHSNHKTPHYAENDVIKVFNYDGMDEKQLSITTPRGEFLSSIENNLNGDKTIKDHSLADHFPQDDNNGSSVNSFYDSKESKSNEKYNKYSDGSNGWHHSNEEKRSCGHSDLNRLNSARSYRCSENECSNSKEKGVIHVIGRNRSQIKVPMISLGKGSSIDKTKEPSHDIKEVIPKSSRSNSSKNGVVIPSENEKGSQNGVKYLPITSSTKNSGKDMPYSNNPSIEGSKASENPNSEYVNLKIAGKDLEVIKENHSEFSNSNSVIETFRNKRKSNISSSGNNSGDQHIIHNAQEMINEEDEEDIENDTTSFRGPNKISQLSDIDNDKEEDKQLIEEDT